MITNIVDSISIHSLHCIFMATLIDNDGWTTLQVHRLEFHVNARASVIRRDVGASRKRNCAVSTAIEIMTVEIYLAYIFGRK